MTAKVSPVLRLSAWLAGILPEPLKVALYRLGPFTRLIRGVLNRAAPAGLNVVTVASGGLSGFSLSLNLKEEKDYWLGTYELALQRAIRDLVDPGMIVYDVGANIGYTSLLLAKAVGEQGKVFAFEALPGNIARLQENLRLNGLNERVEVFNAAVTSASHPVRFLVHASGEMGKVAGSAGRDAPYQAEITVPGISLDDFIFRHRHPVPQVVKMDIEGGEVLALPGMRHLLSRCRPTIMLELHGRQSAQVVWDSLTTAGYQMAWMARGYPRMASVDELRWKTYLVALP